MQTHQSPATSSKKPGFFYFRTFTDMQDLKPVPKVWASTGAALLMSIVIAALVRFGWTDQQAAMIAPAVVDLVLLIAPPAVVFLAGYATPDGDRKRLQAERDQAQAERDEIQREVIEYIKDVSHR